MTGQRLPANLAARFFWQLQRLSRQSAPRERSCRSFRSKDFGATGKCYVPCIELFMMFRTEFVDIVAVIDGRRDIQTYCFSV